MTSPGAWVLAVDFGTTNTVAAVGDSAGVRTLTVDGQPVMPSAVLLSDTGNGGSWMVGNAAIRFARRNMDGFEGAPKRSVPDGTVFLSGRDVPVEEAIAALFAPIVEEAARQHGGRPPQTFVVTHPAPWLPSRVEVLRRGARRATQGLSGWPAPQPLSEPVAAAQRTLDIAGLAEHARLVVLDLGGGTVDVTVVDRHPDGLAAVGRPAGIDGLGGEDFDLRLSRWMTAEVGAPDLFDRLRESADPDERERAGDIREHARAVKEQLSRQPVVPAQLPKSPPDLPVATPVQVSRPQLEYLIRGGPGREQGLTEAVELVESALAAAPAGPPFAGVFLVGGSSKIPLLGSLVTERLGQRPLTHGDPTTAVADGAARFALASLPGTGPPAGSAGSAGAGSAGAGTPGGSTRAGVPGVPGAPGGPGGSFGPGGPGGPGGSFGPGGPGAPGGPGRAGGPGGPGGVGRGGGSSAARSGPGRPARTGRRRRRAVVSAVIAALVLAGTGVGVAAAMRGATTYTCSDGTVVSDYAYCPSLARSTSSPEPTFTTRPPATSEAIRTSPPSDGGGDPGSTEVRLLLGHVPIAFRSSCVKNTNVETDLADGVVASVRCRPASLGSGTAYYLRYASTAEMDTAWEARGGTLPDGGCSASGAATTYRDGRLACYTAVGGRTAMAWTDEDLDILGILVVPGLTMRSVYSWWTAAGPD
jgi:hypothetical protein